MEHQQINELVARLETLEHGSAERQELLSRLVTLLRDDVRDEEDLLLPSLQAKLTFAQLRRLRIAWEAVRRTAPTRAHPIVSRRPPGNVISALPLSLIDHGRDAIDALLQRGAGRAAPSLRAASRGLARASHAVERLPLIRRGEDPATQVAGSPRRPQWQSAAVVTLVAGCAALALASRRRSRKRDGAPKRRPGARSPTREIVPGVGLDPVLAPAQAITAPPLPIRE